jgi:hypothetical protein
MSGRHPCAEEEPEDSLIARRKEDMFPFTTLFFSPFGPITLSHWFGT